MNARLLEMQAREEHNMPPEWAAYHWECFPKAIDKCLYVEVTGAIAPLKRDGKSHNWRKMDKTTKRISHITPDAHDAWCKAWSERTGNCSECLGKGDVLYQWSVTNGEERRTCGKCKGTGKHTP